MKIFTKIFNVLAAISLVAMVGLVFYNAFLRYVLNSSYPPSEELSRFFFIWVTYLGIVVAYQAKGHVAVTLVTDKLHGVAKLIITTLKYLVMFFIMGILVYGGFKYTLTCNYLTVATSINYMLVSSSVLVSSAAMLVLMIRDYIYELRDYFHPAVETAEEPAEIEQKEDK